MALKAELEHMLSPQRMQMQFDAWADGSVFDASEEEEEEAGGGGCCPCRRRRRMRIRRSRSSRPGRDTDRGTDLDDLAPAAAPLVLRGIQGATQSQRDLMRSAQRV